MTQQLARLEQLTPARTFSRKMREIAIAVRLEERYSKQEILHAYLNAVYFGDGYYGVEAASRGYFGKPAADLQPHEAALLAGAGAIAERLLAERRSRSARSTRRNLVLRPDARHRPPHRRRISRVDRDAAARAGRPQAAVAAANACCGRYYQEEVRRQLVARFGGQQVLKGGLRVYTGYDPEMQCAAEKAISSRIAQIVKARKAARDLEGSLVALDPASGEVRALVGGRDFGESSYIRATQARRQPGSAFKPIIYAAALERGMAPGVDAPSPRRADHDRQRPVAAGRRARAAGILAARRAEDLEQPRRRAAAAAGGLQPGHLLRAADGHRIAAARRSPRSRSAPVASR